MGEKNGTNGRGLYTVIGEGALIEGTVTVGHDIRVDGAIKGKMAIEGDLIVGTTGVVEADITVKSTRIGGRVVGNLVAAERIELEEKASVMGDIKTKDLIINEGALFHGNCSMSPAKEG
ncbi:MAG: hypothetical protein A2487_19225 [Candidatus Raymondbacteria bacterium RifOxyC12_full_50_8]|uniref:Cell shape determination protein CcmA n=1 Tax=Candidatus Raymondbacteria bacterium RIFOXYD12_FULL_49_13 TaxID=1817890 RepID=A0A1F7FFE8_UNCRA|nr:MAG: hypothetical protein A2248_22550 [Candidatus Raymondbacteria bacterium RIFOXYA2_FULL_49_16]OGK01029.1 MAG: hypothetical protein A2350_11685 [Candidatus Raymondbacteria bacterium RifOxyB12_full_50_8]OGK03380.1 MAG: hypothetical protein A2487_19225 [Candidatus Raymondbacteria bacterium RifOxyC12_full_50_8]OGK05353.1 MAG: hypothetical protein A2519_03500 [Candidatus Raymondbacteria bacterium RIFOXYD12_FULL_49_13]OGP42966.1 MAG: hypothetical protein A2324_16205 [Candidatus Raymondbacteria b